MPPSETVNGPSQPLRILFLEDVPEDYEVAERGLRREGLEFTSVRVETHAAFEEALAQFKPDVVVSDYSLPSFNGMEALRLVREQDAVLPFIVLTGSINEETAVECIKSGASDYVIKEHVARLPFAVRSALARAAAAQSEARACALQESGQEALRRSEERYRRVSELISDYAYSFVVHPDNGLELEWLTAEAFERITRYPPEVHSTPGLWLRLIHPDDMPIAAARSERLLQGHPDASEFRIVRNDGNVRWLHDVAYPEWDTVQGRVVRIFGAAQDITERKQAEQALHASEDRYRALFEQSVVPMSLVSPEGRVLEANPAWFDLFGYSVEDLDTFNVRDMYLDAGERDEFLRKVRDSNRLVDDEVRLRGKDGTVLDLLRSASVRCDADGRIVGYQSVFRDVTKQKRAESARRQSEERYRLLFEQSMDAIWLGGPDGRNNEGNQAWLNLFGYTAEELAGLDAADLYENPGDREVFLRRIAEDGFVKDEVRFKRKDGSVFDAERRTIVVRDATGALVRYQGIVRDITELKRAREEERRQRVFAEALMETSPACILVFDIQQRIVFANYETDRVLGLPRDQVVGLTCGEGFNLYDLSDAPLPEGEHPACRVFITELPLYAREYVFNSPGGRRILSISAAPVFHESDVVSGVVATVEDVTSRKQRELEREQALVRAEAAMKATVTAMATAVEMRDPYTAGHQTRVTVLACAMAEEMEMARDSVRALLLAGQVHDLGKLRIPAEILTKPGKLTDIEYRLIQEHPQAGYDLLKGIDFGLPVAEIVYQHQERLDGSGYPRGLRGDEILPEARVLAVADVFEAMSSHRPYRAALGVEAALKELEAGSGTLYGPEAVDACVRLVREKGFRLD